MAEEALPPSIADFIARSIRSVEQLEILCLLSAHPEEGWSVRDVFAQIQSSEQAIAQSLQQFVEAGLLTVEADGLYRFGPRKTRDVSLLAELRDTYQKRPVSVIQTIYANRPLANLPQVQPAPTDSPPPHSSRSKPPR